MSDEKKMVRLKNSGLRAGKSAYDAAFVMPDAHKVPTLAPPECIKPRPKMPTMPESWVWRAFSEAKAEPLTERDAKALAAFPLTPEQVEAALDLPDVPSGD